MVAGSEQGFAWNTADVQAGATEFLIFLDDRGLEPELARANGRHVSAGAGTDNYDIKLFHKSLAPFRAIVEESPMLPESFRNGIPKNVTASLPSMMR